jgi:uncharacterized protein (TIGR02145 family)
MRDYSEPMVFDADPKDVDVMKEYWVRGWAPWRFKSKLDSTVSITDIVVKNGVRHIGDLAFVGLPKLNSVTIPASVSSMGRNVFHDYDNNYDMSFYRYNLASINVAADNAKYCSVDGVLFNKNKTVLIQYPKDKRQESYVIPNSVTAIGDGAFICANLKSVTIPRSVTSIGKGAFAYSGLTSVTIPSGAGFIKDNVFQGCAGLTSVTIEEGVTSIGESAFYECGSLTSIAIPRSVISIGNKAFARCNGLTSITTGDGVTSVGDLAFYHCAGLISATFSTGMKSIGDVIFDGCENLKTVTILNPIAPDIMNETFRGIPQSVRLYIPKNRVNAYRHAWRHVWKEFESVNEIAGTVDTNEAVAQTQAAGDGKDGGANIVDKLPSATRQKSGTNGPTFKTVKIGDQTWMAENMNYKVGNSWCYDGQDSNCGKYGRLYDFKTARTVCPFGWRLPSDGDWGVLVTFAGGWETAGKKLKAKRGWDKWDNFNCNGTDDYGFSALPGGEHEYGTFHYAGGLGYWWTAREYNSGGMAYYLRMCCGARDGSNNSKDVNRGGYVWLNGNNNNYGYSVRCILDTTVAIGGVDANPAVIKTVKIGNQTWMAENLNDKIINGRSWCYDNRDSNCNLYGRLYDWETAMTACPTGWHLPSRQEWNALVAATGGDNAAGKALKARGGWDNHNGKNGGGTDSSGFFALPGGFRFTDGNSYDMGDIADWWTSTEGRGGAAYRRGMSYDDNGVFEDESEKSMGFSVRCLRD